MSILSGKNILLGISAGIAAYKSANLVRLFIKAGANVKVVMTPASKDFITPLTLSTLSKNPVHSSFTNEEDDNAVWNNHVELGLWADLFILAPATANTLSNMANGACDNLLMATYLSAKCPVYFAPAMDLDMYKHETTRRSFQLLKSYQDPKIPWLHTSFRIYKFPDSILVLKTMVNLLGSLKILLKIFTGSCNFVATHFL